ncbi:hypothetical protein E7T06_02725 [Deinococcus sp. Arct2-2]|uniref:hypothetical protein n=1 Tax=Deinococcus sp. Arct2-2 TaxID=2568653 RepID=UPI0010A48DB8|nr:hypothetical protein [Deinococcus sp. Arct2-2]THF71546.1 hypothetical protein E7T06_02725 [Deinococcus sp. Arct2-2]
MTTPDLTALPRPADLPAPATAAQSRRTRWVRIGLSGLAGAVTVTLLNETVRRLVPHAPRIEIIGERALSQSLKTLDVTPPRGAALYRWTLLGDLLSNSIYFGLVAVGKSEGALKRGGALGLAAGVGAVVLPEPLLGLGKQPGARTPFTPLLTAAWYVAGGLAAAAVARKFDSDSQH